MKRILITIALMAMCAGAFAQGTFGKPSKISMEDDSNHLIYVMNGLPSGITLMVDLFGGPINSRFFMQLQHSTPATVTATSSFGLFGPTTFTFAQTDFISSYLQSGEPAFMQVRVRDSRVLPGPLTELYAYWGTSDIFSIMPSPSSGFSYSSIVNPGAPAFSTWAPGTFDLGNGDFAAIVVQTPEPSGKVLAGLGVVFLRIFRRRRMLV